ncbi:MAG: thiamine pyrophosphate-binding protein [Dehalococcoidia bacterium]
MSTSAADGNNVSRAEWGSDVVVEMMQAYGIKYAPTNLGATFRGLLDSIINFGNNEMPEVIECLHEEIAVSIAHGYAKVTETPLVALVHNVVGTLHATMAIYDAYAAKAPVIIMSGTGPMSATKRRPRIDWVHTALVQGNLVRDYVKWDDQPHDPDSFPESLIRAYRIAMTEPKGPVYIALDAAWQEARMTEKINLPDISKYEVPTAIQGDPGAIAKAAQMLADAESPLIIAGRVGKDLGAVQSLIELAEAGSIPVIDGGAAFNFPNTHPLDATGTDLLGRSDLVVLLDVDHLETALVEWNRYTRETWSKTQPGAKVVNIGTSDIWIRSTITDFGRIFPTDLYITADTSLALPELTKHLRQAMSTKADSASVLSARMQRCQEASAAAKAKFEARAKSEFDARPITYSRMAQELWNVIKDEPGWIAASGAESFRRSWVMDRPGCVAGGGGAGALGTGLPKAVGVGLAAKEQGGYAVALGGDGDLLYVPSTIWTAVHHNIPLLMLIRDNGGYQGEGGHVTWTSEFRDRSTSRKHIATDIQNPRIDIAAIAKAQGAYAEGPIEDPNELGPAIARAFKVMKENSTMALITVRSQ